MVAWQVIVTGVSSGGLLAVCLAERRQPLLRCLHDLLAFVLENDIYDIAADNSQKQNQLNTYRCLTQWLLDLDDRCVIIDPFMSATG